MVMALRHWWLVGLLLACGGAEPVGSGSESAAGDRASESGSDSDSEVGDRTSESDVGDRPSESAVGDRPSESAVGDRQSEPNPEPAQPSEPSAECTTARDCPLLTDSCGNRHGAPNGTPQPQRRPRHCPANDDPPREPVCRDSQCQTGQAQYPAVRACNETSECVVARAACGAPVAVNRAQKEAFEREQRAMAERIRCRQVEHPQNLRTECLVQLCVLR